LQIADFGLQIVAHLILMSQSAGVRAACSNTNGILLRNKIVRGTHRTGVTRALTFHLHGSTNQSAHHMNERHAPIIHLPSAINLMTHHMNEMAAPIIPL
jgi:hypothetical protein